MNERIYPNSQLLLDQQLVLRRQTEQQQRHGAFIATHGRTARTALFPDFELAAELAYDFGTYRGIFLQQAKQTLRLAINDFQAARELFSGGPTEQSNILTLVDSTALDQFSEDYSEAPKDGITYPAVFIRALAPSLLKHLVALREPHAPTQERTTKILMKQLLKNPTTPIQINGFTFSISMPRRDNGKYDIRMNLKIKPERQSYQDTLRRILFTHEYQKILLSELSADDGRVSIPIGSIPHYARELEPQIEVAELFGFLKPYFMNKKSLTLSLVTDTRRFKRSNYHLEMTFGNITGEVHIDHEPDHNEVFFVRKDKAMR